ncbi:MAG: exodeoxyribonuclease VII large subunit [Pseudomonadota bacterium]|nr:exodeoxyribonuclease VII large subunit [Pseudomonadota bacterium]
MNQPTSNNQEIISVSEVNSLAKGILERDLSNIWIQGEISSFTAHSSGHWYFTIKDKNSSLSCVMFKFENQNILFEPKVGDELILNGNVGIYAPTGKYQFNVKHIEVFGEGALLKAYEELKKKLEYEGLFEASNKKDFPTIPKSIAVITSETGAVLRDIVTVLRRRSPTLVVTLIESQVQGRDADKFIVQAIKTANKRKDFDLIILARGGGSIEDLWCFNMESVAREIFKSRLPIVSAIGHETDFTISDFVADLRAPTPSAAAELISENHFNLPDSLERITNEIIKIISNKINYIGDNVKNLLKLIRHPGDKLRETTQQIDNYEMRIKNSLMNLILKKSKDLEQEISILKSSSPQIKIQASNNKLEIISSALRNGIKANLEKKKKRFSLELSTLQAVSPLSVLARGYSIISDEEGRIVRSSKNLSLNQKIKARFGEGQIIAKVTDYVEDK